MFKTISTISTTLSFHHFHQPPLPLSPLVVPSRPLIPIHQYYINPTPTVLKMSEQLVVCALSVLPQELLTHLALFVWGWGCFILVSTPTEFPLLTRADLRCFERAEHHHTRTWMSHSCIAPTTTPNDYHLPAGSPSPETTCSSQSSRSESANDHDDQHRTIRDPSGGLILHRIQGRVLHWQTRTFRTTVVRTPAFQVSPIQRKPQEDVLHTRTCRRGPLQPRYTANGLQRRARARRSPPSAATARVSSSDPYRATFHRQVGDA